MNDTTEEEKSGEGIAGWSRAEENCERLETHSTLAKYDHKDVELMSGLFPDKDASFLLSILEARSEARTELSGTHLDLTEDVGSPERTADEATGESGAIVYAGSFKDLGETDRGRQRRQAKARKELLSEILDFDAAKVFDDVTAQHAMGRAVNRGLTDTDSYGDELTLARLAEDTGISARHFSHCRAMARIDLGDIERALDAGFSVTHVREIARIRDAGARSVFLHFLLEGVFANCRHLRDEVRWYIDRLESRWRDNIVGADFCVDLGSPASAA